ncbi:uncharacterized protein LOC117182750 [Belonocnema kinseyi]|uniref:uncharacterized protein LOC117182750 n=1 Tax=Belonocnema kinseyi TaxID=2817044 RepID=UPI00143CC473|nr:uncharacterized protein LOC117182750 [Belonocnema kinseyi]
MFRNISGETDEEMQGLDLKPLQNFVQRVIVLSEETKSVLQSDCDEARFALKSWPNEATVHKEMDKICTCNATELDDQLQINDIDRSILQRQELKEKLKTNLLRERSRTRKPDVREIYMPKSKSLTRSKRSSSKSQSRLESRQESRSKITSEKISDENNPRETKQRSSSSIRQIEVGSKSSSMVNKKLPQLSRNGSKVNLKTGSQTNYVLANKQNFIKNKKPSEKNNLLPPLVRTDSTISDEFIKMQIQNPPKIIDERPLRNGNCSFHGNNANTKTVRSVDAVEGLDRHGVPSSLVKVLKVYHSYLKIHHSETESRDKRSKEASAKFLIEFNNMCSQREQTISKSEKIPPLVKGFIEILGGLYDRDKNRSERHKKI